MDKLTGFLDSISKPRFEEDFVDRLNYRVTGYILLAAAITLSAQAYVGEPIQCWIPRQFKDGWEQYVENYCFVENTYWVPFEKEIPDKVPEREKQELNYYQWVPFVLALQALMANIPHLIWRVLNNLSGIEVRAIITMASDGGDDKSTSMIARHLKAGLQLSDRDSLSTSTNPISWIARWTYGLVGAYITITYLAIKVLFVVVCILQFLLLNAFLDTESTLWGADILFDLFAGREWNNSGRFPRVTMCDFEIRELGSVHRWTVQCVLMINMFNEKIYLFLWWWFLVVTTVTILNFLYWLVASILPSSRKEFLLKMLNARGISIRSTDDRMFNRFANNVVRSDGVLVLRLLARNAGEMKCSAVVANLWDLSTKELMRD